MSLVGQQQQHHQIALPRTVGSSSTLHWTGCSTLLRYINTTHTAVYDSLEITSSRLFMFYVWLLSIIVTFDLCILIVLLPRPVFLVLSPRMPLMIHNFHPDTVLIIHLLVSIILQGRRTCHKVGGQIRDFLVFFIKYLTF